MKRYKDLNLKRLREKCDIDFAHYTYKRGQKSCYGPKDMAVKYWRNNKIAEDDNYSYILFRNIDGERGSVTKYDYIDDSVCIEWNLSDDQLEKVCKELKKQLGSQYSIIKPKDKSEYIQIKEKENWI